MANEYKAELHEEILTPPPPITAAADDYGLAALIGGADTWREEDLDDQLKATRMTLTLCNDLGKVHEVEYLLLEEKLKHLLNGFPPHDDEVRDKVHKMAADAKAIICIQTGEQPPTAGDKPKPTPPTFSAAKPYTLAELEKEDVKPPEFIVSGLLPVGLSILAAPPKMGKSWLVLDMLDCICNGKSFWGRQTTQCACLYCDLEGSKSRLKGRFQDMSIDDNWSSNFNIIHVLPPMGDDLLLTLQQYITSIPNLKVIVIDTIGRIKQGAKRGENSYEGDTRMFGALQQYAIGNGLAIVCITHLRKKSRADSDDDPFEMITGSMGLMGVADSAWLIAGQRDSAENTFVATGRDMESVKAIVSFNHDDHRWTYRGDAEQIARQAADAAYESNPIVLTLRELMKENAKGWTGTADELRLIVLDKMQQPPMDGDEEVTNSRRMTEALKHLQSSICKRDRLLVMLPQKLTASVNENGEKTTKRLIRVTHIRT